MTAWDTFDFQQWARGRTRAEEALTVAGVDAAVVQAAVRGLAPVLLGPAAGAPAGEPTDVGPAESLTAEGGPEVQDVDPGAEFSPTVYEVADRLLDRAVWVLAFVGAQRGTRAPLETSQIVSILTDDFGLPCSRQGLHAALDRHLHSRPPQPWVIRKPGDRCRWQITKACEDRISAVARNSDTSR